VTRAAVMKLRQRVVMKPHRGMTVVQKWPRKRHKTQSERQQAWVNRFSLLGCIFKTPYAQGLDDAKAWAAGTGWWWRDVFTSAANGNLLQVPGEIKIKTPTCLLKRTTIDALTANILEPISWESEEWDNHNFWTPSPTPSRIYFEAPGLYLFGSECNFENSATDGSRALSIRLNGTDFISNTRGQDIANQDVILQAIAIYYFHAEDYVEAMVLSTVNSQVNAARMWAVAITPEQLLE